jgi:membrane-associated phospholipid phosphatase
LNRRLILFLFFLIPAEIFSQNIDIRLLRSINSEEILNSDKYFRFITNSDTYVIIGTPVILAGTGLIRDDDKMLRNAFVIAAASIVNAGVTSALKYSVNRERPFETYPDILKKAKAGSPSFPSGHTSSAFATATSLSLSYPEWYVIVPSFAYAGTIAYSRMHLGVHYPSDVAAGALIGAGCAYLTFKVNKAFLNKNKRRIKPCNCPDL